MNVILKSVTAIALSLSAAASFAAPIYFTTHNNTDKQSNAFIAGTIPSPYPTAPHATKQVYWNMVRFACFGHTTNGKCDALVKMATDTDNPIVVGSLSMDVASGDISPKTLSGNGYTITINGPGEATITKD